MGYTNETTHYSIPLPLGSDKTTPMDYNTSAQEVDTVLFEAKTDSASALQKANQLQQDLSTTNNNVTNVTGRVTTLEGTVRTQGEAITRHENAIRDVRQDAEDMIVAKELTQAQMSSSTEALAVGTYFRYNDVLYRVTQAISVGDTIIPNTNCVATNVGAELKDINSYTANEHVIGTYVNKKLYRKIIDIGQLPSSAGTKDIRLDISSPFTIRHFYGYASTGTTQIPLPFANDATSTVSVMFTSGVLRVEVFDDRSAFTEGQVVIEYTKD